MAVEDPTQGMPDTPETRIQRALHYAIEYGDYSGAHHKQWVIDQMCRDEDWLGTAP